MKCTACNEGVLNSDYLESLLPCRTCSNCGGHWLALTDYLRWLADEPVLAIEKSEVRVESVDTQKAMICPKTGKIMTKYRITSDSEHRLDLSPSVDCIWLDSGEWQLLKQHGLADRLNQIFTRHWQQEIREQESSDILRAMYQRKFGERYASIKAFRKELMEVPDKHSVIAYLIAEDPYSPDGS